MADRLPAMRRFISIMRIRNTAPVDFEQVAAEEHRRAGILAKLASDPIESAAWRAVMGEAL